MEPTFFDNAPTMQDGVEAESGYDYKGDVDFETFTRWFKIDSNHNHEWRLEAKEAYNFVAGTQWSQEDAAYLKLSLRPLITFNRIAPVVDSVAGLEVNNRQQVCFFPRHVGDAGEDELLTGAAKWLRDECNAEDEESDSFFDMLVCGMGWTETKVTYDDDLDGKLVIERQDPLMHYWDAGSVKKNLVDAKRIWFVKDVPLTEAEEMFPDVDSSDLHAGWAAGNGQDANEPHNAQEAPFYRNDQSGVIDRMTSRVRIVEVQWWEHETIWRLIDPITKQEVRFNEEEFETLKRRLVTLKIPLGKAVRQRRKQYYKAFLGDKILQVMKGPEEGGFTRKCMTAKRDRNKANWYGIVRAMIDPQKWANKWLSQTLHILNTNAKGGLLAEQDAFVNPQQAEDTWSQSESITWLARGGLNKIGNKPMASMPPAIDNLMQFAIGSIRDVSGVNLELLGNADRNQPGILEHQRKQAAMTILAGMFDSLRRYRKESGVLLLHYITNYLSDGRLIKIGGADEAKYVPLIRNPNVTKYDVIVDDTPNSVNIKEQAWGALQGIMPLLSKMEIPMSVWLSIMKYSPLPASLVSEISQDLQNQPPKADPKAQMMQAQMQLKQQEMDMRQKSEQQRIALQAQSDNQQLQMQQQAKEREFSMKEADQKFEQNARMKEILLEYMLKERDLRMEEQHKDHEKSIDRIELASKIHHDSIKANQPK